MLRGLVLLFLLLNAALWFWIRDDPQALRADREPERLGRQVHPEAIQVLPDLPAPQDAASAASAAAPSPAASAASAAATGAASGALVGLAAGGASFSCAESGPLDAPHWYTLVQALARAGVPPAAISERREVQPGRWIVYMGRYADEQQWQRKAEELRRLNLKFDRVSAPPGLDPGLSLGSFSSPQDAAERLAELGRHGVRTARVVMAAASSASPLRHLQVRAGDDRWRDGFTGERFGACPPAPAASV